MTTKKTNKEKIARICWNTNNWKFPSGIDGKSKDKNSHERKNGYGHEEWLLDNTRIMDDGYHYGFLQAMNITLKTHEESIYNIHLFTISPNSQRVYIGCLHNAEGVTCERSKEVYNYYKQKGWLEEMKQDVISCGCSNYDIDPQLMFNVRFKFKEAEINYSNQPIIKPKSIGSRYNLMNLKAPLEFLKDEEGDTTYLNTDNFSRTINQKKIYINPLHKKIQNAVYNLLASEYTNISMESSNSLLNQRIDIKGKLKNTAEWHFFEIKTDSAKKSIREALGQILEYTHYPCKYRATSLFIIGPEEPDELDIQYLKFLRDTYHIPIWFRWYSFEDNKLHDKV